MSGVKLVWITPEAEKLIAYCARVSSPNQENPEHEGLLRYCIKHHHWSIFEMASACLEIETTRAVAPQILRHRSFSFQEFSQRYAVVGEAAFEVPIPRRQDEKNRQSSHEDLPDNVRSEFALDAQQLWSKAYGLYDRALKMGVAKESARFLLPGMARTRLYMSGTIRSWIHYFEVRTEAGVQKEHRDLALAGRVLLSAALPTIAKACRWEV